MQVGRVDCLVQVECQSMIHNLMSVQPLVLMMQCMSERYVYLGDQVELHQCFHHIECSKCRQTQHLGEYALIVMN